MSDLFTESKTNAAEYTVSEISNALRRTVEDVFGNVRVRGEISGYRGPHSSGHAYFSLKDDRARIDAVIWRSTLSRLKFPPEEGMEVVATGRLTTFPGKSAYQIVIDSLQPAGAGALMALLEERKKRLRAEGLFEEARKRRLPYMPAVIGVVTSPTGSVIRDIIHRIKDRFPLRIVVWPVRVQGETSASEVAAAVSGFNALPPLGAVPRPDVIIVARGGGSLEDLWGFNDEALARIVAASSIPLISAVGHETDWTLIDFVADVRAPTPTGAAEMAVPVKADLEAALAGGAARLRACASRGFDGRRTALRAAARALPSPDQLLALPRRRFDEASTRLERALAVAVERRRARLSAARLSPATLGRRTGEARRAFERAASQLPKCADAGLRLRRSRLDALRPRLTVEPLLGRVRQARQLAERDHLRTSAAFRTVVRLRRERLRRLSGRLAIEPLERRRRLAAEALGVASRNAGRAMDLVLERLRARLTQAERLLSTLGLSDQAILDRGYAMVIGADGRLVRRAADVTPGAELSLKFADGLIEATAAGESPKTARPASPGRVGQGQGTLF